LKRELKKWKWPRYYAFAVCIKLPKVLTFVCNFQGAAVEDGRLKPGDRLLEVNGVEMTGKTQSEAVAILRNAPQGSKVSIVVSRQEDSSTSPRLPRQIVRSTEKNIFVLKF
jgi:C-terminal processing protease CtpA/Prc